MTFAAHQSLAEPDPQGKDQSGKAPFDRAAHARAVNRKRWGEPVAQFLSMVEKTETCWLWLGNLDKQGYGRFQRCGYLRAHRFSYASFVGPIPDGLWVLHSCDNPRCVNPDHLRAGTPLDNSQDRDARGRGNPALGSRNAQSVLTEDGVRRIRSIDGATTELAQRYGVSEATISNARNSSWKHVEPVQPVLTVRTTSITGTRRGWSIDPRLPLKPFFARFRGKSLGYFATAAEAEAAYAAAAQKFHANRKAAIDEVCSEGAA